MGLPFELVTFIGSTLIGGLLKIFASKSKAKSDRELAMITIMGKQGELYKQAREYDNKGFQWTKRIIALSCTFSIIVAPIFLGAFMPQMPVWVGYTEMVNGFWPFTSDATVVKWTELNGLVITPLYTHLMSSIIGMYFGGSLATDKR